MKQVLISQGAAVVEEVPAPVNEAQTVLVRVNHSCISVGTEMSGIQATGVPLWKRALKQPSRVKAAAALVAAHGIAGTKEIIAGRMGAGFPTGYSLSGIVIEVGAGITDLEIGDRVSCAGAQCAHHAEIVRVPRNLCVPVPEGVDFASASAVTLGAIAMQGVRRASPTLGENFVVIGLGVLGQLTAQLLRANGCRVIGVDLDRKRIALARELGMDCGIHPDDGDDIAQIARLTDGIGADGVIITAATPSDAVVSTAFKMCRRKGRVVLVGDVGLHLNRADFYQKEIDFFISTSYGPGRYDSHYEEEGLDYPVSYVRWTENRNLSEFLRLIGDSKIQVAPLIAKTFPLADAGAAYESLKSGESRPLMVLLSYPNAGESAPIQRKIPNSAAKSAVSGQIRIAIAGAGGFAKGTHLPNLQALSQSYHLQAVMSRTGHNATATAKQFGANYATTDFAQILHDPDIDAVLIAARHNLHGDMALQALRAGKSVLVEKPLALNRDELNSIVSFYEQNPNGPLLLTGFNRRFSPIGQRIRELTAARSAPMLLNYRMNAGYLPRDHWTQTAEGGGRNIGEACHIYDLFNFLTDAKITSVHAAAIRSATAHYGQTDNFVATLTYADGSVATLTYTALGAKEYPKEHLECYVDGKVLVMEDYRKLTVYGAKAKGVDIPTVDKGQKQELEAFAKALKSGGDWPIPLWQQIQATEISFDVEAQIRHTP